MPSATAIGYYERRLVEMGCPMRQVRARVRELADHFEDLKLAGLEAGLPDGQAEAQAETLLGDPVMLAENVGAGLRQSSWWGRHPVIGYCLAPLLAFGPLWAACGLALYWAGVVAARLLGPAYEVNGDTLSVLAGNADSLQHWIDPANCAVAALALIVLTYSLCRLAGRSAVGLRWKLAACAACMAAAWTTHFWIQPHNLTLYLTERSPSWPLIAIPAAAAGLAIVRQRRLETCLDTIPPERRQRPPANPANTPRLRRILATPTYWIVTPLFGFIVGGIAMMLWSASQHRSHEARLRTTVWPAERSATLALLAKGHQADAAGGERTIDLKPWLNASLLDTTDGADGVKNNNLAELPAGTHVFAGVPFDVEGRMQLAGLTPDESGRKYPGKIRHIVVNCKCDKIHLLHGASHVQALNRRIARLVLHYHDGTKSEIGIVSGADVLDWWGPIYKTDAGQGGHTTSPGTALAWAGGNSWIQQRAPDFSLRLYRSTFANPHPEREIASIDYVSALTDAAPFLAGLTLEQSTRLIP